MKPVTWNRRQLALLGLAAALLTGCAGSGKPKPADLGPNPGLLGVRQAWSTKIGEVAYPLDVQVSGGQVALASSDGTVLALDARSGRELWRASAKAKLTAGVGSDGKTAAVATQGNEIVAFEAGRELWRQKLSAQVLTAPFVAGGRVFVLGADRTVTALDGASGRRLWTQQRPGEALVLRQPGVILAVGDTLVVGLSGRLVGLNPLNGTIRWDAPVATPRGTNDVERLVDLVGRVSRVGDSVCTRAFQAGLGCVDASRGTVAWTKPSSGYQGVHGDDRFVFGPESDGKLVAWRRSDGERAWVSERLRYRQLTAPLALGRSVIVGDESGIVHFVSREDGSPLTRVTTDGSAIVAAPVVADDTLVVVTRNGGVFGFAPE
ncbi:outer membrane protein assembly factor BamB [Pseudorhodoferax sp. Leaf267]|uniref:outer membrane protein assembly factor BamB n=1 Tax=Pseudorhodoferax sp. Leaf267 TaxID=1736316 RepID=UPI0006FE7266|nr:outer membrane protein assembly factor BamB [Pseudorhodoferax sp. Leaf267]KQP22377.1 outer membrane protein assembly factor BamB [Pseudorhodoferax sp. Leaf267]